MKRLSFRAEPRYLSRKECIARAREIIDGGLIDMSEKELAMEIYFHARIHYRYQWLAHLPGFRDLVRKADPIDLRDGGDTHLRRFFFRLFWVI